MKKPAQPTQSVIVWLYGRQQVTRLLNWELILRLFAMKVKDIELDDAKADNDKNRHDSAMHSSQSHEGYITGFQSLDRNTCRLRCSMLKETELSLPIQAFDAAKQPAFSIPLGVGAIAQSHFDSCICMKLQRIEQWYLWAI